MADVQQPNDQDPGHQVSRKLPPLPGGAGGRVMPSSNSNSASRQLSASLLKPVAATMAEDEDDGDDDDDQYDQLQLVLQKALTSKKNAAAQKQTEVLQQLQNHVASQAKAMESTINKEAQDTGVATKAALTRFQQRLADRLKQMQDLTNKYQADLQVVWNQYNEEYGALEQQITELKAGVDKRKAGTKRKLAALGDDVQASLTEASKKVEKMKTCAGKLPGLAKMLQALI